MPTDDPFMECARKVALGMPLCDFGSIAAMHAMAQALRDQHAEGYRAGLEALLAFAETPEQVNPKQTRMPDKRDIINYARAMLAASLEADHG